jgi:spore coat polysaccharide biosynthesis predicted glycosyltransferase SpsG
MLCSYLRKQNGSVLLLDSYYVTPEYLQKLSQVAQVVYIDDLNAFLYPVHTVINYGREASQIGYEQAYAAKQMDTHFLLGSEYIPLREEFAYQPYVVRQDMKRVLITMGGTDTLNVTGHLLQHVLQMEELAELEYHVIVGCFNIHKDILYSLCEQYPNIFLHENISNMSEWMRSCDVAISASGSTLYELCACGTPTVCLEIADNQSGAESWETDGYMYYGGDAARNMDGCVGQCANRLLDYKHSADIRSEKSKKLQSLVDGNGAKRIAEWMIFGE